MNKNYTLSFLLLDSMCLSNLPICISLYYTLQNKIIINQNIVILFRCYFNFSASFPPKKGKDEARKYVNTGGS